VTSQAGGEIPPAASYVEIPTFAKSNRPSLPTLIDRARGR